MSLDPLLRICPTCGAEAAQRCIGKRGHERKSFHRARGSRRKAHSLYCDADVVTESPIEKLLVGTIVGWLDHYGIAATIKTQVPIGPFRADILVETGDRKLVVECDGAAWHNSQEQVERDKRRDRYCAARGIYVMRFTGAEIRRDARFCAAEVGTWVMAR